MAKHKLTDEQLTDALCGAFVAGLAVGLAVAWIDSRREASRTVAALALREAALVDLAHCVAHVDGVATA